MAEDSSEIKRANVLDFYLQFDAYKEQVFVFK